MDSEPTEGKESLQDPSHPGANYLIRDILTPPEPIAVKSIHSHLEHVTETQKPNLHEEQKSELRDTESGAGLSEDSSRTLRSQGTFKGHSKWKVLAQAFIWLLFTAWVPVKQSAAIITLVHRLTISY